MKNLILKSLILTITIDLSAFITDDQQIRLQYKLLPGTTFKLIQKRLSNRKTVKPRFYFSEQ